MKHYPPRFEPWIGQSYGQTEKFGQVKILVLGESHYCDNRPKCNSCCGTACPDFTRDRMAELLDPQGERFSWMSTFVKFERALVNHETSREESTAIWNSVAFYNYLNEAVGGPREAGTLTQYQQSAHAFLSVLDLLSPNYVIVWGQRLWENMPFSHWEKAATVEESRKIKSAGKVVKFPIENGYYHFNGGKCCAFPVYHPSGGFSWDFWFRVIQDVIEKRKSH